MKRMGAAYESGNVYGKFVDLYGLLERVNGLRPKTCDRVRKRPIDKDSVDQTQSWGSPCIAESCTTARVRMTLLKSRNPPIRLNPDHSYTVFRVRTEALKPKTSYSNTVDSMGADGARERIIGPASKFTPQ